MRYMKISLQIGTKSFSIEVGLKMSMRDEIGPRLVELMPVVGVLYEKFTGVTETVSA